MLMITLTGTAMKRSKKELQILLQKSIDNLLIFDGGDIQLFWINVKEYALSELRKEEYNVD